MIKYGAFDVDGSFTRVYGEKGICEMSGKFVGREKGTATATRHAERRQHSRVAEPSPETISELSLRRVRTGYIHNAIRRTNDEP
jgi:hypothetical protein